MTTTETNNRTTIKGYEVVYDRRKYGYQWYCWVSVKIGDQWLSLGDPWPNRTPPSHEIEEAIIDAIKRETKAAEPEAPQTQTAISRAMNKAAAHRPSSTDGW